MKKAQRKEFMEKRIAIIKDFAEKMDYEVYELNYSNYINNRPCYSIELGGTSDSEGNCYSWAWYTDTFEEF